jgi:hypothetical protein
MLNILKKKVETGKIKIWSLLLFYYFGFKEMKCIIGRMTDDNL